jgi:hypothetical protein
VDQRNRPRWQQHWHGWTVRADGGDEVGTVVGWFGRGPHEGRLRVHRESVEGTAFFAIPLGAIATCGGGTIRITAAATAEVSEWLAYVVRQYRTR